MLGLVLAMIPGQDSVLSGGPAVWGEAPSSELEVVSSFVGSVLSSSALELSEGSVSSDSVGSVVVLC